MPKVKAMIQQYKSRFQQEPRGPLGSYIKLKDKKWAVAVEGYIRPATLGAFAVDNKKDSQVLQEIFRKVWTGGSQPQIITSKFFFKKHDIRKNLVQEPEGCVSVYNAIEIDDPVVNNCIVDSVSPENILLIPTDDRAQELLSNRQSVPHNCKQGVTIKGDRYYPDPNYRTYASNYRRAQYLQVDTKEYMRRLQADIGSLQSKKQGIIRSAESLEGEIKEQEDRRSKLEERISKVRMARTQLSSKLDELSSAAEPEVQNVHYLEQELDELKTYETEKTAELDQLNAESKRIKTSIMAEEEKLKQLGRSTEEYDNRIQSLQNEVKESRSQLQRISSSDEFDKRRIAEYKEKLKTAKEQESLCMDTLKKLEEGAIKVGDRISDLRQVERITNEINRTKHRIESIETDTGNINAVKKRYKELEEKQRNCTELISCLQTDIKELKTALEQRKSYYQKTEKYFITTIKCYFAKILESRQFKGYMDIKMKEETLELVVQPQHGSQGVTTTANLSGGERSFSTVAFLYSLWQCMEFPFYFLDEFDVYMDKLNRTKVIDILVNHAKSRPQLQFVFLTPQDVSFISKDVSILRLADPERIQAE
ncbi:unnamed protein product [Acanthoscelides obtectus]|uniref:Structural maintenance of chromosomes protein 6 n=2 Tax=Acanthoscelides obtectus TaxID=200917 RepID=A0A9P0MJ53_ACAOB|nr:unnamed protein product [Acanthoscelides obtectus]CAK1658747.1 Structural maintenance of chromosomes protein 6 [Acanthoscelides obtectus]